MIVEKVTDGRDDKNSDTNFDKSPLIQPDGTIAKFERLFMANSYDLAELLVQFDLAHLFPQLRGCLFVKQLQAKQNFSHVDQIRHWQDQRARRVAKVVQEYNEKGWVLEDNTEILRQPLEVLDKASGLEHFQVDYMNQRITA